MFTLGMKARDKVTGFAGIMTGRAEYLYGCTQYAVTPRAADGKVGTTEWFDEGRIEITGPGVTAAEVAADRPGGPPGALR